MKYYCYRHIRLDKNVPFYIGIARKSDTHYKTLRSEYERAFSKDRGNGWHEIVSSISGYEIEIIYESDSGAEIFKKEREFIKLYGRADKGLGPLVNLTDGGQGCGDALRGKTFMEIHGEKKAKEIIERQKATRALAVLNGRTSYLKGKTFEEVFGETVAKILKESLRNQEKSEKTKNKLSIKNIKYWENLTEEEKKARAEKSLVGRTKNGYSRKGKTFIELYGEKKATEYKNKIKEKRAQQIIPDEARKRTGAKLKGRKTLQSRKDNISKAKMNKPNKQSKSVCQFTLDGKFIKEYSHVARAGRENGIDPTGISFCADGKCSKRRGFIWKWTKDCIENSR